MSKRKWVKRFLIIILTISSIAAQNNFSSVSDASEEQFNQGKKYFFEKRYEAAEQALLKVINSKPNHGEALSIIGDIFLFRKDYYTALDYYKRAEPFSASPAIENFRMGQIYTKQNKPTEAVNAFQKALQYAPSMKINLYQIGFVELVLNRDKQKAIESWSRFVAEAVNDPQNEKIKSALRCLEDPKLKIPQKNESASLEDALLFCGIIEPSSADTTDDKAGHEEIKTDNATRGLIEDNEL
ncbi:MAG: tetratricopeptide repeat protein [Spirochaetia bacterium]|nr:tetratricopeptide repeat protein [Spirochaetia bacterium]